MKTTISLFLTLLFLNTAVFGQKKDLILPPEMLMQPENLAKMMEEGTDTAWLVLNIGPVDNIKGAISSIGVVEKREGQKKLRAYLKDIPKDKAIVFYCGCCLMHHCPNVAAAYKILNKQKFTNFKALNLPKNLGADWVSKNYPLAE